MADKKRPILTALVILGVIALFLGTSMVIIIRIIDPTSSLSFADRIGVILIDGAILDSRATTSQLVTFRKDKKIKAIILRINSPGGGVGPTQEIHREIQKTAETKKVIASLGGVAASGGYYIASAANKIVANPGTIIGSIGVLMEFVHLEDLLEKIGIKFEVLKSGEFKDIGSPHRELTKRDREILNSLISDIQSQFVAAVANGRELALDKVSQIADGRVFSGVKAKELDLIDVLGNFQDAVDVAKDMAAIEGEAILVYPKKSKAQLWELFLEGTTRSVTKVLHSIKPQLEYKWNGFKGR
ncbi:MAG: signal peptide peptidase SppA [Deltaproteobacteria bacterium]|nr:signal peptide peptidase SppA [Deltaproteobacteria bacterium]